MTRTVIYIVYREPQMHMGTCCFTAYNVRNVKEMYVYNYKLSRTLFPVIVNNVVKILN